MKTGYEVKGFYNKNHIDAERNIKGIFDDLLFKIAHENLTVKQTVKWLFNWRYGNEYWWNLQNEIHQNIYGYY